MPITLGNTNITSSTGTVDITGTGSAKIPVGTTAQRPSSPLNGMIRFNTTLNEFEIYGNGVWKVLAEPPFLAEGGAKTISGSTVTHTFTSSGSFVIPAGQKTVDVTVLGGGGGGGTGFQDWATGGGGGGFARGTFALQLGTFPVVVGAAGSGQTVCDNAFSGGTGGTSSFNSTFAGFGGGGGGAHGGGGGGTGGSFQTTGATTVISTGNGGNGEVGGFSGSGGGGNNGFGSGFGTGAAGVPNTTPGNHATGNGNGGGGGHSCQDGNHRGGGDGSQGIVIITYEV